MGAHHGFQQAPCWLLHLLTLPSPATFALQPQIQAELLDSPYGLLAVHTSASSSCCSHPAIPALQPQTRAEMLDRLSDQELAGFSANVLGARYVDTAGARHEIPPPDIDGALQDPLGRSACTLQLLGCGGGLPCRSLLLHWEVHLLLSNCCDMTGAICCAADGAKRL